MERMNTQKEWLDYINRLQERERQKIMSGGLNNWVIAVALLGLAYWLYPDIVNIQKHGLVVIVGYAFFTNILISTFDIFNVYVRNDKIHNFYYSKKKNIDHKGNMILQVFDAVVNLVNVSINVILLAISHTKGYYVFELYFALYSIRYFYDFMMLVYIQIKKYRLEQSTILESELYVTRDRKISMMLIWTGASIFLHAYLTYSIIQTVNFNNLLWKQLFDGFAIGIIVILIQFMITIFIKRIKIAWLEELEKEIVLQSLDEERIIFKLKNGYYASSNIDNYFG
ncbi:hypothetical protein ACE3MZ_20565 [Paenibacillus sp. WLX1005]|uniref:hypothetical protein n=1 Tax=Paenibacillus sp. WLX1005 TaxID=3243766 RepID=UPI0039843E0F